MNNPIYKMTFRQIIRQAIAEIKEDRTKKNNKS